MHKFASIYTVHGRCISHYDNLSLEFKQHTRHRLASLSLAKQRSCDNQHGGHVSTMLWHVIQHNIVQQCDIDKLYNVHARR